MVFLLENQMSNTNVETGSLHQAAVWIDHREALLAILTDAHLKREEEIYSKAGPQTHGGGWSQRRIQAHRHALLDQYYEQVAQNLTEADEIIIYGPGQAKHELYQHLNHHKDLTRRVLKLVTTDKISEREFIRLAIEQFATTHVG
jgi:peptide subunit release factor 1 (eRF1)